MSPVQEEAIASYLAEVSAQLATGHAAEHAYRPALKQLVESFGGNTAVNDPKRSEHGAPDFVFLRDSNENVRLGHAEAKDIGVNLDKIEKTEQLTRYSGYAKLFLTDYLEFRFYRSGKHQVTIRIADVQDGKVVPHTERFAALASELDAFLASRPLEITDGAHLANVMGASARRIRENAGWMLAGNGRAEDGDELRRIYGLIKELLVHDLDEERFADMYAQTLVYGLFAARYNDPSPDDFTRQEARDLVPASNPFLRQFFDHIAGAQFVARLAHIVDELCEVFAVSSVREIVHRHLVQPSLTGEPTDEMDPIIHFYEDFLKAYDPVQRKKMGAYYTPLPVVRFMVRMVDKLLKEEFGLADGLADTSKTKKKVVRGDKKVEHEFHKVQILDPAVGTATFLNEIIKFVAAGFEGQEGRWPSYVKEDLVPRLHGFELMMAPYTVAHLKLGLTLRESGVEDFGGRLGVYLTNTLEEAANMPQTLFHFGLADAVAQEAVQAGEIKNERPIMVVIGNPPYAGISSNETEFANALIDKYKVEPGGKVKLQERKHWLNDDYVKFVAFAEEMISRNGSGIVAMITNHGYLDNPTFRGMRWRLTQTFDSIYVIDLHGNAKKKEVAPDGGKDQNVFDIQQGVAIMFGVVTGEKKKGKPMVASVDHAEVWGTRRSKFAQLVGNEIDWSPIELAAPMFVFAGTNFEGLAEYEQGVSVADLFPVNVTGIVTARDSVVIDTDPDALSSRIERFKDLSISDDETRSRLFAGKKAGKYLAGDSRGWQLVEARRRIQSEDTDDCIQRVSYRPFDDRYIYYSPSMVDWPRLDVMPHFLRGVNLGLVAPRLNKEQPGAFVTQNIIGHKLFCAYDINNVFPLYLHAEGGSRTPNLDPDKLRELTANLSAKPEPEDVLDYCYGVLHSPAYREKYKEFLKTDFPRVPVAKDDAQWNHFVTHGRRLRELHLMTSTESQKLITKYPVTGSDEVDKPRFEDGKVFINATQYFDGVPEVAWSFYIGGYQPARKWLKDRKGRKLTSDDILHYQRIVTVLTLTDQIMREIDGNA